MIHRKNNNCWTIKPLLIILVVVAYLAGCTEPNKNDAVEVIGFDIKKLSDVEYPDNPDIGFRASDYQNTLFAMGALSISSDSFILDFSFYTKRNDTVQLENIDVSEFIPTIPKHVKRDEYLSYVSCINQEWNRNQVRFNKEEFASTNKEIVRVDIARNCLNAYLWEVILYVEENGSIVPYAHGWFDFPHNLYVSLFEKKNNIPFATYKESLEEWVTPENKKVDLNVLRDVLDTIEIVFRDRSDAMYPLSGAREKKFKEIIYPSQFKTMRDLQSDSTLFATFTPPGFYNRKDPRKTQLGRFYHLANISLYKTLSKSNNDTLYEIILQFNHKTEEKETSLVIGGLDLQTMPLINTGDANTGWKNSMGIGNHTFYETNEQHNSSKTEQSPYYAMLLDGNGNWLDSHDIGIDGPIFYFSGDMEYKLNLWLLSFERHALVGHYEIVL